MSLSDDDHACPVCGGPMRLVTTIRRVPGEQNSRGPVQAVWSLHDRNYRCPKPGESTH